METLELIESLHSYEKRIILALKDMKKATIDELVEKTGLPRGAIEKASAWARTKGVIEVEEKKREFVELTEEGKEYALEGLPEKNLLKLIARGEAKISQLKRKFPKFGVAMTWVMKNDWAKILSGNLLITESGKKALEEKSEEEVALEKLKDGRVEATQIPEKVLKNLLKRKLVKVKSEKEKTLSLTELGKNLVPELEKVRIPPIVREKILKKAREEKVETVEGVITQLTPEIIRTGAWRKLKFQKYNVKLPTPRVYPGKRHFLQQVIERIRKVWIEMGFKEMVGPIVEVSFWNFDALFQPQDHPARDLADTFYMKTPAKGRLPSKEIVEAVKETHESGWITGSIGWQYEWDEEFSKRCVLRTHTTSLSARTLATLRKDIARNALPAKYFAVGRTFRNETLDWKHLAEFHQTEGIVVGENVNFKHLLGYLKEFFSKLGFKKVRFRPAYFPYTEMSTEVEIFHPERKGWVELGGSGIFRPEVVKPLLGVDVPVLAWGLAVERLAMLHYGIEDIRELYSNDLKQLREIELWLR